YQPTSGKVNNVIDAVRAISNVPIGTSPPAWLAYTPDCCPPPADIVPCANGLLHLPTGGLQPSTPAFFSLNALDYGYAPEAPKPTAWLKFISDLWGDDIEAIDALQDWLGYCLTNNTRMQKIAMVVGPRRSGKGTIARVATAMLGQSNVCHPSLASLSQNF